MPPQAFSSDFSVSAKPETVFVDDEDQSMINTVEDEEANKELLHELAAHKMSNEPSTLGAFEVHKDMLHDSSTLMSSPDAIKLYDEKLAAPKALISISKRSTPNPLQEDTTELKITGKKHETDKTVTERQERYVAAGLLLPLPLNNRTEPKARITLTKERGEVSKPAALLAKLIAMQPLVENRKKRNYDFASADTKRVGTNGQLMPLIDVKPEKEEGPAVTQGTLLTRSAGIQKSAYVATRGRVYLPVAGRSGAKRYDATTLRAHLAALAQQIQEDEASNAAKCDEYQRYTILKGIPLPEGTQLIAHKLLQQRNFVRKWQAQPHFGQVRNDDTEKSKRNHEKLGVQLATAVSREIDDGLDGMALAMSMVNDIFGIKGSA